MDLQLIHNDILFLANRSAGAYFTPSEIDNALHHASLRRYADLLTLYLASQKVNESLASFKKEFAVTSGNSTAGLITLPTDFGHLISIETQVTDGGATRYVPVPVLSESEISYRRSSQVIPLTTMNPAALLTVDSSDPAVEKVQLYPASTATGTIYYLKKPVKPSFSYTQSGRTITYVSGSSTQLEWNDIEVVNHIVPLALSHLGIHIPAPELIQWAESKNQQTA